MLRFKEAIEDTYDDVTTEYFESTEYRELSNKADNLYEQLRRKPDNWEEVLDEYHQTMRELTAAVGSNSYVYGVYAGMAELNEFRNTILSK